MQYKEIEQCVQKIKGAASNKIYERKWNEALSLISAAAEILYNTNLYYSDQELEDDIFQIAKELISPKLKPGNCNENVLMFYDGFGLDRRGLAQIYLKALCKLKRVVYVTYEEASNRIPEITSILSKNGGEVLYLKKTRFTKRINDLQECIECYKPKEFFFYSLPNDVVATTIMNAYQGIIRNFQINLTDHAFWLGVKPLDYCIEFRSYGANISRDYRNVPESKIVEIPFYPVINYQDEFQGFPFPVEENKKVVFSGGSLYKTLGDGNKYYKIVQYMLEQHPDVIFWYAGTGDRTEMDRLIQKYPNRVFLTPERSDLFQVLKHCYLYLSTYPVSGGLMFQYAASASKVPITLRQGSVTDGFLISQSKLKIQFDNMELLLRELDQLLEDPEYAQTRGEIVKNSVITEDAFENAVEKVLGDKNTGFSIEYKKTETEKFRQNYLERLDSKALSMLMAEKDSWALTTVFPKMFLKGAWIKLASRIKAIG